MYMYEERYGTEEREKINRKKGIKERNQEGTKDNRRKKLVAMWLRKPRKLRRLSVCLSVCVSSSP